MLTRTIRMTSEEYHRVIAIANEVEKATGYRPSFSQVIGSAISKLEAPSITGGHQDDRTERREDTTRTL